MQRLLRAETSTYSGANREKGKPVVRRGRKATGLRMS